LGYL
jgi:hypothetical protein